MKKCGATESASSPKRDGRSDFTQPTPTPTIVTSKNSVRRLNRNQRRFGLAIMAVKCTAAASCWATRVQLTYTDSNIIRGIA